MSRPINKNIMQNAINKLYDYKDISIISNDDNEIIYMNKDGLKEKKNKYNILKENFKPFNHSLRSSNEFCVYNANILANKTKKNKYNSLIIAINKQNANIICGCCGKKYTQNIQNFIKNDCEKVCNECYNKIHIGKKFKENEVFENIKNFGYEVLPNQHYKDCFGKIGIKNSDGYKGEICYKNILNGAKISPFAKYNTYALENIRYYCKKNGVECKIPNQKYNGWDSELKVECSCGKLFKTTFTHFYLDNKTSCDVCTKRQSSYETVIENWLILNKINYKKQYKFKDCFYKKELPFDFYLDDYNILIEVDGEGHFKPIRYNGSSKNKSEEAFKRTQRNDEIKNKYCISKGIKLVRISYIDINNNNYINILQNLFIKK